MKLTNETLKNPVVCYSAIRDWMYSAGEDFLDYNCAIFKVPTMVMWMLGKGYINNEKAEKLLGSSCVQELLLNDLFDNYSDNLKEEMEAYIILSEYFSIFAHHRNRLLGALEDENITEIEDCKLHELNPLSDDIINKSNDVFNIDNVSYYDEYVYFHKTKGFTITCNNCGSNNVDLVDDIDYDYEESPYVSGHYLQCNNCGESEDM